LPVQSKYNCAVKAFAVGLLAACTCVSWPQAKQYIGTYEVVRIAQGKRIDNGSMPPGQVTYVELFAGGHWVMKNMLAGFDGTWVLKGKTISLTTVNGPSGLLKSPEKWVLAAKPDHRLLVPTSPKTLKGQMELRYAPKIKDQIASRIKAAAH
jgi:hypothetical protein